eukprot:TRINITY_DN1050_c0_g1_i4.p1 TRINITY_DN1050_c0_g1~~TRINITY_DN1050_c0_g1_i4.p1  ORF type:complete len:340 (-),score=49.10 TRINITY_DN1050_c0_g1_i4:39-1058(-)
MIITYLRNVPLVVLLLFVVLSRSNGDSLCTYANDCSDTVGSPMCIFNHATQQHQCAECDPTLVSKNCACPPTQYCVADPEDSGQGSCRQYESNILGRSCVEGIAGLDTVQGENDKMFCGLVVYNNTLQPRTLEWQGSCQKGECVMCSSGIIPSIPLSFCPDGRVCILGEYQYGFAGAFGWNLFFENPASLNITLILIVISLFVFVIMPAVGTIWYCTSRQKKSKKGEGDGDDSDKGDNLPYGHSRLAYDTMNRRNSRMHDEREEKRRTAAMRRRDGYATGDGDNSDRYSDVTDDRTLLSAAYDDNLEISTSRGDNHVAHSRSHDNYDNVYRDGSIQAGV